MFKDFFFIVKMLILTVLVCLALQVKLGAKTVEQEFYSWIQTSLFIDYLQTAIDGGVAITKTGYKQMHTTVNTALNKWSHHGKKGERGISVNLKRYNQDKEDEEQNQSFLPKVRSRTTEVK